MTFVVGLEVDRLTPCRALPEWVSRVDRRAFSGATTRGFAGRGCARDAVRWSCANVICGQTIAAIDKQRDNESSTAEGAARPVNENTPGGRRVAPLLGVIALPRYEQVKKEILRWVF